jgi:putative transcriptional regulator
MKIPHSDQSPPWRVLASGFARRMRLSWCYAPGVRPLSPRLQLTLLLLVALLMLGAFPRLFDRLREQEGPQRAPEAGLLLVARPGSGDFNFSKTVVLLVEVGPEQTWGLVLNRARTPRDEALPEGADRWGGPVRPDLGTALVRTREAPAEAVPFMEGLSWLDGLAPERLAKNVALTFAGLAAWGPGQLEAEIAWGGWVLMEGDAEHVFAEPEALWAECITPHL